MRVQLGFFVRGDPGTVELPSHLMGSQLGFCYAG